MPARNSLNDRELRFIPNRIVKADELIRIQSMALTRDERGLGGLFGEGGTLNVGVTVAGTSVNLVPEIPGKPMRVFISGSWETIQPATFALNPSKVSGEDILYANWVLWRVTADGEDGTIADASLVDVSSSEKVAEVGQLELTVGLTDNSAVALNANTQLAKNTTPLVVFRLARGEGGSITVNVPARVPAEALATSTNGGMVTLTTSTSGGVAVAADDPLLVGVKIPADASVNDKKVIKAKQATPLVDSGQFGIRRADVSGNYGISTGGIYDNGTGVCLNELIPILVSVVKDSAAKVQALIDGTLGGGGGSSPAPVQQAYTPPPAATVPSDHIGKPLGISGSHPARVDSDTTGFSVNHVTGIVGAVGNGAFTVKNNVGNDIGGVMHDGDFFCAKAGTTPIGATQLTLFSTVAQQLANHVNNHPTGGGGGVTQSYVDTRDNAILAEAKQYTDQHAGGVAVDLNTAQTGQLQWDIVTIGTLQVAFCHGVLVNGTVISLPPGFSTATFNGTAAFSRTFSLQNATQAHFYLDGLIVVAYTQDQDGNRSTNDWASVTGVAYKWA